jgi:RNA polymerase sigma factor (sigma-70 family)
MGGTGDADLDLVAVLGGLAVRDDGGADADARAVERALAGDADAFADLYRVHVLAVRSVVHRHLSDRAIASDIVQETFTRALDRLHSLREPRLFRPWLLSIARHMAIDHRRSRRVLIDIDSVPTIQSPGPGPDELAHLAELTSLVRGCISELSRRDAAAVTMVTDLGFGPAEVGAALGVTPNNAKVIVHRARRRLADVLSMQLLARRTAASSCPIFTTLYDAHDLTAAARHVRSCRDCGASARQEVELYSQRRIDRAVCG